MDDPALDPGEHAHALAGLARVNRLSLAGWAHRPALRRAHRRLAGVPVRVLDVASGGGDGAIALARWAARRGVPVSLALADVSPRALGLAERRAGAAGVAVDTVTLDAVRDPLPACDLVTCSLFLHHLAEPDVVRLLSNMRAACSGVISVSDLRRTAWGTALAVTVPRLLTRSPVVHTDAVISARAAFTPGELSGLAHQAGLSDAKVRPCFPSRMTLTWEAP